MSDRQIQPSRPREREIAVVRPPRARGLTSQVSTVLLQPRYFFRTVPMLADTRQWVVVGFLILVLIGWSAVRQDSFTTSAQPDTSVVPSLPDLGFPDAGGFPGDSSAGFPAPDSSNFTPTDPGQPAATNVTDTLITALISASHILLGWFVLGILLCEVSLFNGRMPNFGLNLQLAVWSTVPLGVMAGVQLLYFAAGGKPGALGLNGLLPLWKSYGDLPIFVQSVLLSLSSRTTLFWLWSLLLLYVGARSALRGKWWASFIVVVAWVLILAIFPVITGAIQAPEVNSASTTDFDPFAIPSDFANPFEQPEAAGNP